MNQEPCPALDSAELNKNIGFGGHRSLRESRSVTLHVVVSPIEDDVPERGGRDPEEADLGRRDWKSGSRF